MSQDKWKKFLLMFYISYLIIVLVAVPLWIVGGIKLQKSDARFEKSDYVLNSEDGQTGVNDDVEILFDEAQALQNQAAILIIIASICFAFCYVVIIVTTAKAGSLLHIGLGEVAMTAFLILIWPLAFLIPIFLGKPKESYIETKSGD